MNSPKCPYTRFKQLFSSLLVSNTKSGRPIVSVLPSNPPGTSASSRSPLTSWKRGHHVFFLFTQSLIIVVRRLNHALEKGDVESARILLDHGMALLNGSAVAMRLAGDCRSEEYATHVRPTMPEGFSGLDGPDHGILVKEYARLKKLREKVPAALIWTYRRFEHAADAALQAHLLVCATFGGKDVVSLKSDAKSNKPAYEVLTSLGQSRLKSIALCPIFKPVLPKT